MLLCGGVAVPFLARHVLRTPPRARSFVHRRDTLAHETCTRSSPTQAMLYSLRHTSSAARTSVAATATAVWSLLPLLSSSVSAPGRTLYGQSIGARANRWQHSSTRSTSLPIRKRGRSPKPPAGDAANEATADARNTSGGAADASRQAGATLAAFSRRVVLQPGQVHATTNTLEESTSIDFPVPISGLQAESLLESVDADWERSAIELCARYGLAVDAKLARQLFVQPLHSRAPPVITRYYINIGMAGYERARVHVRQELIRA